MARPTAATVVTYDSDVSNTLQMDPGGEPARGSVELPPVVARVIARVIAIGGLDPTGGAGLVRDYLTARALGAEIRLVASAFTEQSLRRGVVAVEPRDPAALVQSVRLALELVGEADESAPRPAAVSVKIGMVPGRAQVEAILDGLRGFAGPVIVDPVVASSSGGRLFLDELSSLRPLLIRATLVTPNTPEAARLSGMPVASLCDAVEAGRRLQLELGLQAVLIKGGHLSDATATDVFLGPPGDESRAAKPAEPQLDQPLRFEAPRLAIGKVRGTGCALATAIAVELARGHELPVAIRHAKAWLTKALTTSVMVGDERHLRS
jgi:hydroxymethylpyrimidine/phosphomethylpyrimidine kinase